LADAVRRRNEPVRADGRILGTGAFAKNILKRKQRYSSVGQRTEKMKKIIGSYCKKAGIQLTALQGGARSRPVSRLRVEIAFVLVKDLGISYAEIGRQLGITTSAVSRIMERREAKPR
jgi:chromosomal replication initiation ATPase DnaA